MRNVLAHVPPKQRPAVVALLRTIFAQDTAEAAHAQWKQVADTLRERFSKLAERMDGSRDDVLAYMAFPREHWAQIASTNPLERLNREIKRRSDVVGIFPNDPAVVRLVGALMLEQNDEWAVTRRYMSLESLSALSDDPVLRLPAVAASSPSDPPEDWQSYTTPRDTTRHSGAVGQAEAIATFTRRALIRTRAPILRSLRRIVPQVASANWVWRKPRRRNAQSRT